MPERQEVFRAMEGVKAGDRKTTSKTEAAERRRVIARRVLECARCAKKESAVLYRKWQASVLECEALRARLPGESPRPTGFWTRILSSWMPVGSRRRRIAAAGFRRLQDFVGRWRRGGSVKVASIAVGSPPQRKETRVKKAATRMAPEVFSPLHWRIPDELPPDSRFINLILLSAEHRSGSTLLQRICNARKGTLIWGEHGGLLKHFTNLYAAAACFSVAGCGEREAYFGQDENPNLWIANMSPELSYAQRAVVNSARAMLGTFYAQHREDHDIVGFKEVSYGRSEWELLRRCYPEAHFLLLVRHPVHTWRSTPQTWCPLLQRWTADWNANVKSFREIAGADERCSFLRYEDLIEQNEETLEMLVETARVSRRQIAEVLAHKVGGSRGAAISDADREFIATNCREQMAALGYE